MKNVYFRLEEILQGNIDRCRRSEVTIIDFFVRIHNNQAVI